MTILAPSGAATLRTPTARRYLMCRPDHFEVAYAINPWMDPTRPVDRDRAVAQWEQLRATYERLGHMVELLDPVPGLPDMVFAANGGLVVGGRALGARFTHPQRTAEAPAHLARLRTLGLERVTAPTHVNEGEGDFVVVGDRVLAGTGYRTDPGAHVEAAEVLGVEVLTLELVDPRFYHLDVALMTLSDDAVAVYAAAFTAEGLAALRERVPTVVEVAEADALVLGLNGVSDGLHVVLEQEAVGFRAQLTALGFVPVPVPTSELRKSGGSVKCCTQELRGLQAQVAA